MLLEEHPHPHPTTQLITHPCVDWEVRWAVGHPIQAYVDEGVTSAFSLLGRLRGGALEHHAFPEGGPVCLVEMVWSS